MDNTQEPLTRIRQAEVNVIRRVALAQERAERIRANAKAQAAVILETAHAQAERDGQILVEESLTQVRLEERAILAKAKDCVESLVKRGKMRRRGAVEWALHFVLGEKEVDDHDS